MDRSGFRLALLSLSNMSLMMTTRSESSGCTFAFPTFLELLPIVMRLTERLEFPFGARVDGIVGEVELVESHNSSCDCISLFLSTFINFGFAVLKVRKWVRSIAKVCLRIEIEYFFLQYDNAIYAIFYLQIVGKLSSAIRVGNFLVL